MNKEIIFTVGMCLFLAQKFYSQTLTQTHISQKELNKIENIENHFDLKKIEKFGWRVNYETEKIDSIGVNWSEQKNKKTIYSFGNPLKLNYKNSFTINLTYQNSNSNIWRRRILITKKNESETIFKISGYAVEFENSNLKCQSIDSFRKKEKILSSKSVIKTNYSSNNDLQFSTRLGFNTKGYNQNQYYKCFVGNTNIIVSINFNSYIKPFDFSYYSKYDNKYFFDYTILKPYSEFFNYQPFNFFKDLSAIKTKHLNVDIPYGNSYLKSTRGNIIFNNNIILCQFYLHFEKKIKENKFEFKLSNDEIVEIKLKKLKKHLKKLGLQNIAVNFEQLYETSEPRIRIEFLLNNKK